MTPKTGTPSTSTLRERILAATDELFFKQGVRAVGVEAIAEAAGTNKMTLYRYFSSKDELIAQWVGGMIARKDAEWDEMSRLHEGDPQGHLQDWSRRLAAKLAASESRGSAMHNALSELPEEHPARKVIREYKKREHRRVRGLCEEAGFQDPDLAANLFYMMLEGAVNCVSCIGTKQIGAHLVQVVDLMIENNRSQGRSRRRL